MKIKKILFRIILVCFILGVLGIIILLGINMHIKRSVSDRILKSEEIVADDFECIFVLGCNVWENGEPSHMLRDRLLRGIELYNLGISDTLLMSGDHGQEGYNEVQTMKDFAIKYEIPSEDVFMDHAGFSTYESIYRAKEIFGVDKMVIVTQEYHLYRALYMAEKLGVEAYGVGADSNRYYGQTMRDVREVLARAKDFIQVIIKPEPTYLGDKIDITGSGDVTND